MGNKSLFNGPGHMTIMTAMPIYGKNPLQIFSGERSGSVVECLTWDRRAAGSSLTGFNWKIVDGT